MAGILNAIEISSKGLSIQRARMNSVAKNIANAETTKTEEGGPYRRERVTVKEGKTDGNFTSHLRRAGLKLNRTKDGHMPGRPQRLKEKTEFSSVEMKVAEDAESNFKLVHDPGHPDADEDGYVKYPDIEIVNEMVDMMAAARAYEANTVAISAAKKMAEEALDI
ncbi:MAG: flagellar basal body rod protein FlgC [Candidatus Zixiibacteriota bacterium]|nr:MAG: flagellar basal body rod protein FlgC [candidate division Zixibacteria bacterium]